MSLREVKKSRTRREIQQQALRLFRDQGYADTTVEQIAAAAETSPSTVFRYFAKKEDMVLIDDLSERFVERYATQLAESSLLSAFRRAFAEVIEESSAEELSVKRERQALVFSVPELWGANLDRVARIRATIIDLVRQRTGDLVDESYVRGIAGSIFGVLLSIWFEWAADPDLDVVRAFGEALDHLQDTSPS